MRRRTADLGYSEPQRQAGQADGGRPRGWPGRIPISDSFRSTGSIIEIRAEGVMANADYGNPGQIFVTTRGGTIAPQVSGF